MSRTLCKKLQRPATIPKMYLALQHFPALFGASPTALPAEGDADAVALRLLTDCRDGFAHPKSMRNFYPPALLASALPAIEWLLSAWHALLATCLNQLSGREPILRERTFRFDAAQAEGFEKKLAPLYEPSETPAFMKIILALTDDTAPIRRAKSARRFPLRSLTQRHPPPPPSSLPPPLASPRHFLTPPPAHREALLRSGRGPPARSSPHPPPTTALAPASRRRPAESRRRSNSSSAP